MTIARVVSILRPTCVVATIAIAMLVVLMLWGWQPVGWDMFWKVFFTYVALIVASTLICYIENPKNLTGRG